MRRNGLLAWSACALDLDSVRADLIAVIHDTVHPAHASVWLRGGGR